MKKDVLLRCLLLFVCLGVLSGSAFARGDTLNIVAIRVQFQEDNDPTTTGNGLFDMGKNTDPYRIDPPPHDKKYFEDHLRFAGNYFYKVSHKNLLIPHSGRVFPAERNKVYQLERKMADYNRNTSPDAVNRGLAELFRDAVKKADLDPALNFSKYELVIVFHAGVGRDIDVGLDPTPKDIPSLFLDDKFLSRHLNIDGIPVKNGHKVTAGIVLPETETQEGRELGLNGILVANIGSYLGLLDLFNPKSGRSGVGRFALMDFGSFNGDGLLPALPMAWHRMLAVDGRKHSWEEPVTIWEGEREETIYHALSSNPKRIYKIPINEKEYFLLENRHTGAAQSPEFLQGELSKGRPTLASMKEVLKKHFASEASFDAESGVLIDLVNPDLGLPGSGVLVWHIDENVIGQLKAENQINVDPEHRGIDLEEADGSQDIGEEYQITDPGYGSELGTPLDFWYAENEAPIFKQAPRNAFSLSSIPNSRSYTNRSNSHVRIFDFSRRDSIMTFRVKLNFFQKNFPLALDAGVGKVTSVKVAGLDDAAGEELIMTTDRNEILVVDQNGKNQGTRMLVNNIPADETLLPPAVIFPFPNSQDKALGILTVGGTGRIYRIRSAALQATLFSTFRLNERITTHPVIGSGATLYWGTAAGNVYQLAIDPQNSQKAPSIAFEVNEPITRLHFKDHNTPVIVTAPGSVFLGARRIKSLTEAVFQPVGEAAAAFSPKGNFLKLAASGSSRYAENGLHRFDTAPIAIKISQDNGRTAREVYLSNGDNNIYFFNYNFTLRENFPLPLYETRQENRLFMTPLMGYFPDESGNEVVGVIAADPGGMINGFDINGTRLADFPLAVGDSLSGAPALLDIDNDADIELACVTRSGRVYIWDFSARMKDTRSALWPQQYGNAGNQNRSAGILNIAEKQFTAMLPAEKVYNWPNPNTDPYTFIRYYLNEAADVNIKIYDLAGDLVTTFKGPGNSAADNQIRWELSNIQSGVYIGKVEAKSKNSGKTEVQMIKIAVVK